MNKLKQRLDFELNFISNYIPWIENDNKNYDTKYFCIYRCHFNDGIKIYQIQPNLITVIEYKRNIITKYISKPEGKIKPIVSIDPKNGELYFLQKNLNSRKSQSNYLYSIYKHNDKSISRESQFNDKYHNFLTQFIVYDKHIFLIQQKKICHILNDKSYNEEFPQIVVSSSCNDQYLALYFMNHKIALYDYNGQDLELVKKILLDFPIEHFYLYQPNIFIEENLYINIQSKHHIYKISNYKSDSVFYDLVSYDLVLPKSQIISHNFIKKYINNKRDNLCSSIKYRSIFDLASEIDVPNDNYAFDVLFFGPSFYLPIQTDSSLYSNLNKIKNDILFKNELFWDFLSDYSSNRNTHLRERIQEIIVHADIQDIDWDSEIEIYLKTIKLPESVNEESIVHSESIQILFGFIIAEIMNTYINLLIIKIRILKDHKHDELDDAIKIYSSLYKLISSDLIKLNSNNEMIKSNLYILNTSFSPLSIKQQIFFLYKGKSTFSKLPNTDIIRYNNICPEPYVEQRVLDVARAYSEQYEFGKCIELLAQVTSNNEDDKPIQNVYISHLLKQFSNDFQKQFILLKTLNKKLPKNMYKSFYIISLKAEQFPEAVDEFFSKDALKALVLEIQKNTDMMELYKETILKVLEDKECQDIISLMN